MLELSDEPKRLVSTFLAYRNDVDIYTEDELKDKEFYKVLFNRLVGDKIKINDITPLGSKETVIERCKNEPDNGRKKLFIVDGDIRIIHGANIPALDKLYVLDAYCIENFVFDKVSVLNFIYLNCATKPKEEIEIELDFDNWLFTYSNKLIDLFLHYAIIDLYGGRFTLFNVHKFHSKESFIEDLVINDINILKEEILKLISETDYQEKYRELKEEWSNSISNFLTVVSGKDYLIPILLIKTKLYKSSRALPSVEEAKFFLVHNCNLERLNKLKETLETL